MPFFFILQVDKKHLYQDYLHFNCFLMTGRVNNKFWTLYETLESTCEWNWLWNFTCVCVITLLWILKFIFLSSHRKLVLCYFRQLFVFLGFCPLNTEIDWFHNRLHLNILWVKNCYITETSPVSVPVVLLCCSYSATVHPLQTTCFNTKWQVKTQNPIQ